MKDRKRQVRDRRETHQRTSEVPDGRHLGTRGPVGTYSEGRRGFLTRGGDWRGEGVTRAPPDACDGLLLQAASLKSRARGAPVPTFCPGVQQESSEQQAGSEHGARRSLAVLVDRDPASSSSPAGWL
ncbi:hypothetical protein NDU88_002969 [Pleurodeles waltl]|uniref:Uncharacterized protein n=1 Tax=Pleurodeles waltl TaxID=8319 RepID=A0AAV7UCF7_PLEWA|nr:hypothetical protein NDU88_002969 [Pleurodeles waltl]